MSRRKKAPAAPAPTNKEKFNALFVIADKLDWTASEYGPVIAMMNALDNAADTFSEKGLPAMESPGWYEHQDEYYGIAYASISQTSPFTDSQAVEDWFRASGYQW